MNRSFRWRSAAALGGLALGLSHAAAQSTFAPLRQFAWAANIGWTDWHPFPDTAVAINEFYAAGFLYGANVGWIQLGSGSPANGLQYQNNSSTDFGVNLDALGNLRGFAYGANIGWINFEATGAPRIDLVTGKFSGFAYGANVGWINLGDAEHYLQLQSLAPGMDTDADGLPDAWELRWTGDLTRLSGSADSDRDGLADREEYDADTDPLDREDAFRIVDFAVTPDGQQATITWSSRPTRVYRIQQREEFSPNRPWTEAASEPIPGVEGSTRRILSVPLGTKQRFYRVTAMRPLS